MRPHHRPDYRPDTRPDKRPNLELPLVCTQNSCQCPEGYDFDGVARTCFIRMEEPPGPYEGDDSK